MTVNCIKCKAELDKDELEKNFYVCPKCFKYNRIAPRARIALTVDGGSFTELFSDVTSSDPIGFPDYRAKLDAAVKKSGENEGVLCGTANVCGHKTCIFVMNTEFMMGSMGTVVGDKIAALFEYAKKRRLPVVGYTASGGARMQEGVMSLMQMTKVSMAVKRHSDAGLFYLCCLTDPTTGGVTASFAMLADIIIAEPGALVGFAGRRVIEQNTGEKLPDDFQSAEFQKKSGFVDAIVKRGEQRKFIGDMLAVHCGK